MILPARLDRVLKPTVDFVYVVIWGEEEEAESAKKPAHRRKRSQENV